MQFYIVSKDHSTNANTLPDYALKKVNIREGWQILSDCGHAINIKWKGQNKEYNRYHPNTWRFWKNKNAFFDFFQHYVFCLEEYRFRFGEDKTYKTYKEKLDDFIYEGLHMISGQLQDKTEEQHIIDYLLDRKHNHLTEMEVLSLRNLK